VVAPGIVGSTTTLSGTLERMAPFRCESCGEEHEDARDVGYGLPDDVFAIPAAERPARVVGDSESCVLDGARCFVRCILEIPTPDHGPPGERVGIGAWAEVARVDLRPILDFAGDEHTKERPIYLGRIANAFGRTIARGEEVVLKPWSKSQRPRLYVTRADHPVTAWQSDGIPWDTWQRILARALPRFARQRYHERAPRFALSSATLRSTCACCDAPTVVVTTDVTFDGVEVARYVARTSGAHAAVTMLISLAESGAPGKDGPRVCIHLELLEEGTRVLDAGDASLPLPTDFGTPLTREEALAHSLVDDVFEISDVAREREEAIVAALAGLPVSDETSLATVAPPRDDIGRSDRHRHRLAAGVVTVMGAVTAWAARSAGGPVDRFAYSIAGATIASLALFVVFVGDPRDVEGLAPPWYFRAASAVACVGVVIGVAHALVLAR
jgi:hypothetical protein